MSLALVLAGLYPPTGKLRWNEGLNWQPVPYTSLPLSSHVSQNGGTKLLWKDCGFLDQIKSVMLLFPTQWKKYQSGWQNRCTGKNKETKIERDGHVRVDNSGVEKMHFVVFVLDVPCTTTNILPEFEVLDKIKLLSTYRLTASSCSSTIIGLKELEGISHQLVKPAPRRLCPVRHAFMNDILMVTESFGAVSQFYFTTTNDTISLTMRPFTETDSNYTRVHVRHTKNNNVD